MGTLETKQKRLYNQLKIAMVDCMINKTITVDELEIKRQKIQIELDQIEWILNEGQYSKYASVDFWTKQITIN